MKNTLTKKIEESLKSYPDIRRKALKLANAMALSKNAKDVLDFLCDAVAAKEKKKERIVIFNQNNADDLKLCYSLTNGEKKAQHYHKMFSLKRRDYNVLAALKMIEKKGKGMWKITPYGENVVRGKPFVGNYKVVEGRWIQGKEIVQIIGGKLERIH